MVCCRLPKVAVKLRVLALGNPGKFQPLTYHLMQTRKNICNQYDFGVPQACRNKCKRIPSAYQRHAAPDRFTKTRN